MTSGYRYLRGDGRHGAPAVPRGNFEWSRCSRRSFLLRRAVAAVGECINYLFDPKNTQSDSGQAISAGIQRCTCTGWVFLLDVAEPGRARWVCAGPSRGEDWAVLVTNEEDDGEPVLTRRITSFRRVGDLYRRDQEVHRQRLMPGRAGGPASWYRLSSAYPRGVWHVAVREGPRSLCWLGSRDSGILSRKERLPGLREDCILGTRSASSHVTAATHGLFSAHGPGMAMAAEGDWPMTSGRSHGYRAGAGCMSPSTRAPDDRPVLNVTVLEPRGRGRTDERRSSGCSWLRRSLDGECRPGGPRSVRFRNDRS